MLYCHPESLPVAHHSAAAVVRTLPCYMRLLYVHKSSMSQPEYKCSTVVLCNEADRYRTEQRFILKFLSQPIVCSPLYALHLAVISHGNSVFFLYSAHSRPPLHLPVYLSFQLHRYVFLSLLLVCLQRIFAFSSMATTAS